MASSSGFAGARIASDRMAAFMPLGAFGKPAWQSYAQLRAMLLSRAGTKAANFFARPSLDADSGTMSWFSELPGTPRSWEQLPQAEKAQRALDLEIVRSALLKLADEMRGQGNAASAGGAAYASLLAQAVKVPAKGNFLYFVGDQPVLAFWGFTDGEGRAIEPAALAPEYARLGAIPEPVAPASQGPSSTSPAPSPGATATRGRRWWWWLLALLALLLLLLVLFGLRSCVEWSVALWREAGIPPIATRPQADTARPAKPAALDDRLRDAGAGTGDVQVSIAWNNINDIDLKVTVVDPANGKELSQLWFETKQDRFGGRLDIDQNRNLEVLTATPVENVFWPVGRAPAGRYIVEVRHFKNHGAPDPTVVQVRVLSGGKEQRHQVELREGEARQVVTFERKAG